MAEITKLNKHSQGTTRNKYKTIARAKNMKHDELMDHVQHHMLNCDDDDCDICDLGESGSMIDNDDEGEGPEYDKGSRSSNGRFGGNYSRGPGHDSYDIDSEGKETEKEVKGHKHNLMKHGEHLKHSAKHPGFAAVKSRIAAKQHISEKAAARILAFKTRHASPAARKANPRLARVKG